MTSSSKRQKELARRRAERQAARRIERQRQRRKKMALTYGGIFGLVLLLILGLTVGRDLLKSDAKPEAQPTASATPTPTGTPPPLVHGCYTESPQEQTAGKKPGLPPKPNLPKKKHTATIAYEGGTVVFDMFADKAPCTVNSFVHLAAKNYFDNTQCHRITTGEGLVVVQCGDPTGTGSGGPGYRFKDENLTGATYKRGTVAMANAGPGTNGSQFFLVVKDSQLPANYTPFGTITSGLDFLDAIIAKGVDPSSQNPNDGKPKEPVKIKDFTIKVT